MDRKTLIIIAFIYLMLLAGTGFLSFFKFVNLDTTPTEKHIQITKQDPDMKEPLLKDLIDDLRAARQRNDKLIDLSAHSFDVTLGALLGFLSAAAISAGIGRARSTPGSTGTEGQQQTP